MNKNKKTTKYCWAVLTTDRPNPTIHDIEIVGIYKHRDDAVDIAIALPFAVLRSVPVIDNE